MSDLYVNNFVYTLGGSKVNVVESAKAGRLVSTAADLIAAGFEWHHLCEHEHTAYDLAKNAVTQLDDAELLTGVDAIVYATCLPQNGNIGDVGMWRTTRDVSHLMDFPASRLQDDFALDRAVVVGLNQQGCTGMLGAIRLGAALLVSEPDWTRVLCVTADRFPDGAVYEQAYNLISDGAAACVISRERLGFAFVTAHQITNGGMADATNDQRVGSYFPFVSTLVRETLQRADLEISDIDWIVPQNTNHKAWKILSRLLGVDIGRVWQPSMRDIGHAISSDNIINLSELVRSGRVRAGQRILLLMIGHGINCQAVVLKASEDLTFP